MLEANIGISIRRLSEKDASIIATAFSAQGWNKPREKFGQYFAEQGSGQRAVLIAETQKEFAGYVTVVWVSAYRPFNENSIPEIVDLNVLKKHQRKSIGTHLMEAAEQLIAERSDTAGIRVGLTADYGAAQRLYVRRGYVPDGHGVSQRQRFLEYGDEVIVDDDLTIGFTKSIR